MSSIRPPMLAGPMARQRKFFSSGSSDWFTGGGGGEAGGAPGNWPRVRAINSENKTGSTARKCDLFIMFVLPDCAYTSSTRVGLNTHTSAKAICDRHRADYSKPFDPQCSLYVPACPLRVRCALGFLP